MLLIQKRFVYIEEPSFLADYLCMRNLRWSAEEDGFSI